MNYIVDNNNLADFKQKLKTGNWIVWYFAPWCGHCKMMKPEWEKFMDLKNQDPVLRKNLNCASVSDSMIPNLEDKYREITGFPTIKFYRRGNQTPNGVFDMERTSDNLKQFSLSNLKTSESLGRSSSQNKSRSVKRRKSGSLKRSKRRSGSLRRRSRSSSRSRSRSGSVKRR